MLFILPRAQALAGAPACRCAGSWDALGPTETHWDPLGPTGTRWDLLEPRAGPAGTQGKTCCGTQCACSRGEPWGRPPSLQLIQRRWAVPGPPHLYPSLGAEMVPRESAHTQRSPTDPQKNIFRPPGAEGGTATGGTHLHL